MEPDKINIVRINIFREKSMRKGLYKDIEKEAEL